MGRRRFRPSETEKRFSPLQGQRLSLPSEGAMKVHTDVPESGGLRPNRVDIDIDIDITPGGCRGPMKSSLESR